MNGFPESISIHGMQGNNFVIKSALTFTSLHFNSLYNRVEVSEIYSEHVTTISSHLIQLCHTVTPTDAQGENFSIGAFQCPCGFRHVVLGSPVGQDKKDPFPVGSTAEHVSEDIPESFSCVGSSLRVPYWSYSPKHLVCVSVSSKRENPARSGRVNFSRDASVTWQDPESTDYVLDKREATAEVRWANATRTIDEEGKVEFSSTFWENKYNWSCRWQWQGDTWLSTYNYSKMFSK